MIIRKEVNVPAKYFLNGGFYKLISWDFGVVFEQIAVQNEMKKSPVEISIGEAGEQKRAMRRKPVAFDSVPKDDER